MRILYVSLIDVAAATGAAGHVAGIASGLARLGHDVTLVTPMSSATEISGVDVRSFEPAERSAGARARRVSRLVKRAIREQRPGIVYLRGFPLDWFFAGIHASRTGVPYVVELNTRTADEYRATGKRWRAPLYRWAERISLRRAAAWLPVSREIAVYARSTAKTDRPWHLARNGYDPATIVTPRPAAEVRAAAGGAGRLLVMSGFAHPWHGADRALAALSLLDTDHRLWLVGARSDEERRAAERAAADAGVGDRVDVFPWREPREIADLVGAADIGLGPLALDRNGMTEAQPLKVASYLALGVPVLLDFDDLRLAGNQPFVVRAGGTSPDEIAAAIRSAPETTPGVRAAARDFAAGHLTWDAAAEDCEPFLRRIAVGTGRSSPR